MSEFIAEAQVLIRPNTATFAATLKAQLEAAVAAVGPVAVPVSAVPVAAGAGRAVAAETAVATAAIEENSAALHLQGVAAERSALAQKDLVRVERSAALAHSQAARGIAAETLSLTGLRGATLAASAPFLAGATAAIIFSKSIKAASDEAEELNKTVVVFGDSADQIEQFSKTTATALGISSDEALQAAGIFGNLFRVIKISEPVAADMSQRLVTLASDLASFNNASPERTLEALRSGLVGQARPLRAFGIFLSAARVQQEALVETGKDSIKQLTEADKVQARFNIILRDSNIAAGDFARTSDRLANQSRILKAQLANISVEIGRVLIPTVLLAVQDVNLLIQSFTNLGKLKIKIPGSESGGSLDILGKKIDQIFGKRFGRDLKLNFLFPGVGLTINNLELLNAALKKVAGSTDEATQKMSGFHFALGGLPAEIKAMQAAADSVDFSHLTSEVAGLETAQLKIQTGLAPGGRAAEEANLRKQIEDDKKLVDAARSGTKKRKEALQTLKSDQDALAALQAQDAQDAQDRAQKIKDAASKRKAAARKAAQAQQDATQAFLDAFGGRQQQLQNKLTTAQLSGNAAREIAVNKKIVAADRDEIKAIQDRIRHLKLHGDALKIAKKAIRDLNQEIFSTRNSIAQLQEARRQAVVDSRQSHLEAQLAIAETTKSTKDDIAAEKALIAFDQAQIRRLRALKKAGKLTRDEAAALDAYRVDLAQRKKALQDLKGEVQDTGKKFKELSFAFLQTQSGFAANLLGNLIPGGKTGGLVGGSGGAAGGGGSRAGGGLGGTGLNPSFNPGGPANADLSFGSVTGGGGGGVIDVLPSVHTASAVAASRERGVRPVQVDTTNQLLRQILRSLQNLNGRAGHPEARYNDHLLRASMDGVHGN